MPFGKAWMDLQTVIQSEVSQKQKNKYHILMHICGIQKNGTDKLICKAEIETQTQKTIIWTPGAEEGGMNWEIGTHTHTHINYYV